LPVYLRGLAGGFFDQGDEFAQFDGARFTEVDDLETEVAVQRGEHALKNVIDVGVVPPGRAIAENFDGLPARMARANLWIARSGRCRGP